MASRRVSTPTRSLDGQRYYASRREAADGDVEIDPCWEAWARVSRRHPKLDASTFRANWERWEAIRSAIPLLRWDDLRGRFVLPKARR